MCVWVHYKLKDLKLCIVFAELLCVASSVLGLANESTSLGFEWSGVTRYTHVYECFGMVNQESQRNKLALPRGTTPTDMSRKYRANIFSHAF